VRVRGYRIARLRNQKGLGVLDAVVVILVVSILIAVVVPYYQKMIREGREAALKAELVNVRQAVRLFEMLNQRKPKDLQELIRKKLLDPTRQDTFFESRFLNPYAVDEQGRPLDPFGGAYRYDPERGDVQSPTGGYEAW